MGITFEQFAKICEQLGLDKNNLGYVMMDVEPLKVSDIIDSEDLYYSPSKSGDRKYVQGIVSEDRCHVTLLSGLVQNGQIWKESIDTALDGWSLDDVEIEGVIAFDHVDDEEEYYCLVAELALTPELLDGNARLRALPHMDMFTQFRAHLSIVYVKHDKALKDKYLSVLNERLVGRKIKTIQINYGD